VWGVTPMMEEIGPIDLGLRRPKLLARQSVIRPEQKHLLRSHLNADHSVERPANSGTRTRKQVAFSAHIPRQHAVAWAHHHGP
jgi:hypothetical protein